MLVSVEFFGTWRTLVGHRSLTVPLTDGDTLLALVSELASQSGREFHDWLVNPETGELWSTFALMVNGVLIDRASELALRLQDGDSIAFLHPIQGGLGPPAETILRRR